MTHIKMIKKARAEEQTDRQEREEQRTRERERERERERKRVIKLDFFSVLSARGDLE